MHRQIGQIKPPPAKTPEEILKSFENPDILNRFGFNMRKTERFYFDTIIDKTVMPQISFTLFASIEMINLIKKNIPPANRRYMIDGTFDITPLGSYYQLLIIHIEYRHDVSSILFPLYLLFTKY